MQCGWNVCVYVITRRVKYDIVPWRLNWYYRALNVITYLSHTVLAAFVRSESRIIYSNFWYLNHSLWMQNRCSKKYFKQAQPNQEYKNNLSFNSCRYVLSCTFVVLIDISLPILLRFHSGTNVLMFGSTVTCWKVAPQSWCTIFEASF